MQWYNFILCLQSFVAKSFKETVIKASSSSAKEKEINEVVLTARENAENLSFQN